MSQALTPIEHHLRNHVQWLQVAARGPADALQGIVLTGWQRCGHAGRPVSGGWPGPLASRLGFHASRCRRGTGPALRGAAARMSRWGWATHPCSCLQALPRGRHPGVRATLPAWPHATSDPCVCPRSVAFQRPHARGPRGEKGGRCWLLRISPQFRSLATDEHLSPGQVLAAGPTLRWGEVGRGEARWPRDQGQEEHPKPERQLEAGRASDRTHKATSQTDPQDFRVATAEH